jgi:predicted dehydrogenase
VADIKRIGILGCGFFAQNHLNAWRDLAERGVEIVAVCDADPAKAAKASQQFGAPPYTDAADMFAKAGLDLVDIVTQVGSHRPLVELSLRAGVPTIVQKPFAPTLADCVAMAQLAQSTAVPLAVHENFRFQPALIAAKAVLDRGDIGSPNWARISFRTAFDIYSGQPYLRSERKFVIADLGAHVLDLARFYLGEVEQITAQTQKRRHDIVGEDTATMLLRHKSGAVSVVECTYEAHRLPDPFPQTTVEIEGTRGSVIVGDDYELRLTAGATVTTIPAAPPLRPWMERPWHAVQTSVLNTCEHILAAFREGRSPSVAAADNLKTMALCEAAYESAEQRQTAAPRIS